MQFDIHLPSPITPLNWPFTDDQHNLSNNVSVLCKRDDLIHPLISGNKWRKLSTTLSRLQKAECRHIVSFGGAYSNHLHALSFACKCLNIELTAVVRGDNNQPLNPTLRDMLKWGTKLHFVSRIDYKKRTEEAYCQKIKSYFKADYLIPEGGSSVDCLQGVAAMMEECQLQAPNITHMVLPVASGGTLAGLITSNPLPNVKLIGIGVLKGEGYLENLVQSLVDDSITRENPPRNKRKRWEILHSYHHGGYAKTSKALSDFVEQFNLQSSRYALSMPFVIEPIYSGKCFYAVDHLIKTNYFPNKSQVMIVHTGGIQGARNVT